MLGHNPFYFGTLRKLVVAVGTIFNDIKIDIVDNNGSVVDTHKVPLYYAPTSIYLEKLRTDRGIEKSLPAIAYEIGPSIEYDSQRQRNPLNTVSAPNPNPKPLPNSTTGNLGSLLKQKSGVPYNVPFTLTVYSNTMDASLRIIEQILPNFTPSYNLPIKAVEELGLIEDIKIILNSVSHDDNYQEGFEHNRLITWTIDLTAKATFYPPIEQSSEILKATANVKDFDTSSMLESVGVTVLNPNPPQFKVNIT